jgi:hypothetical protein
MTFPQLELTQFFTIINTLIPARSARRPVDLTQAHIMRHACHRLLAQGERRHKMSIRAWACPQLRYAAPRSGATRTARGPIRVIDDLAFGVVCCEFLDY